MSFVNPNRPDIATIAGQSPLNSASKLEVSNLEDNKTFKEVESRNTIADVSVDLSQVVFLPDLVTYPLIRSPTWLLTRTPLYLVILTVTARNQ